MKKAAHKGDEGEVVEMIREIFEIED